MKENNVINQLKLRVSSLVKILDIQNDIIKKLSEVREFDQPENYQLSRGWKDLVRYD